MYGKEFSFFSAKKSFVHVAERQAKINDLLPSFIIQSQCDQKVLESLSNIVYSLCSTFVENCQGFTIIHQLYVLFE
jgi:pyoverdine/dityrosine biosynthesis protein Dit1